MKKWAFFLLILNNFYLFSQSDTIVIVYPKNPQLIELKENDTLLIESPMDGQIFYGTMVIPTTSNQVHLYGSGLWLSKLSETPCSHDKEPEGVDRITGLIITDSTWSIQTQITSNCCHKFLGDADIVDETIVNLIYIGYGGNCACYCCFGLNYEFNREDTEDYLKITHIMINGDRSTMIKVSEYQK